ncbi:hypothetical protein DV738_g4694, partial [Chaetothyriales sp. CBS 135597]
MSKSASSRSDNTVHTSPEEASVVTGPRKLSAITGLENIHPQRFESIRKFRNDIRSRSDELSRDDDESTSQFLVFTNVSSTDRAEMDVALEKMRIHTRMTYFMDENLLIVKFPTAKHEGAHGDLMDMIKWKIMPMGISKRECKFVGATKYYGRRSSKEADSAFRPKSLRPDDADWPTIVLESGLSESLPRLRLDAAWWLTESQGQVKTVIVISVKPATPIIHVEKWELAPRPQPTARASSTFNLPPPPDPTQIQQITLEPNTVTGAPLILEFEKLFLRLAVPPESDITFSAQELSDFAADIMRW